jgi:hypothetical protein
LRRYQPITKFDIFEPFRPTAVDSFVEDSRLEALTPTGWRLANPDPAPATLPGPGGGIVRLNQETCTPAAPLGGFACYIVATLGSQFHPIVYGRVARLQDRIVLQYWYFYYHDVYSYLYPPLEFLWQAHEGDWEVVNVVLSGDETPLSVGYSQHCLGQRRSWSTTPRRGTTHPVVYVAFGSHANYFAPGSHVIATECIPAPVLGLLRQNGLALPRDHSSRGETTGPIGYGARWTAIHPIDAGTPWVRFAGFWGELQYFHAPAPIGTVALGTSPVGPAYHAVWSNPLATLASWPLG